MKKHFIIYSFTAGIFLLAVLFFSGCSPQERRGISSIPHNRPASWEYQSFTR